MTDIHIAPELPGWIREHLEQYLADGEAGHLWDASFAGGKPDTPCLILTTTGRKSGRKLPMPLIYGKAGTGYVVVGSKGGAPQHPAWYLNLVTDPKVEVQVANETFAAVARTATGEERAKLWPMMAEIFPPYDEYQKKASPDREVPVVVLDPA